jgi:hypothetical protein
MWLTFAKVKQWHRQATLRLLQAEGYRVNHYVYARARLTQSARCEQHKDRVMLNRANPHASLVEIDSHAIAARPPPSLACGF